MAGSDKKISEAPQAPEVVDATEFAVNEGGTSKKTTGAQLETYVLAAGNVGTTELADESVGADELANAINAVAKAFDADTVDGYHASDIIGTGAPIGAIISWDGALGAIPANWQLCDGTGGTVDLRDLFVVTAGGSYAVGDNGGAATVDWTHSHGVGTLALENSDSHKHEATASVWMALEGGPSKKFWLVTRVEYRGEHSHGVTGTTANAGNAAEENRPPYLAQAFIQRVS